MITKPVLIYDGECGFCRKWIKIWQRVTQGAVEYHPFQEVADRYPEIQSAAFTKAVQLVESGVPVRSGADAVVRLYEIGRKWRWMQGLTRLPGTMTLARLVYRFVAAHRVFFSRLMS